MGHCPKRDELKVRRRIEEADGGWDVGRRRDALKGLVNY